ncbi:MAG: hypothetical protein ACXVPQ_10550 [Bacteroidia bacterium]
MKQHETYTNRIGLALVLLVFLVLPSNSFSENENSPFTDSTKTKYALNDPRNPDCPCHKYQKLADDEFKKLQGVASWEDKRQQATQQHHKKFPTDLNVPPDEAKSHGISSKSDLHKKHNKAFIKFRHRGKSKRLNTWKWLYKLKQWDIWKRIADPVACFKWT